MSKYGQSLLQHALERQESRKEAFQDRTSLRQKSTVAVGRQDSVNTASAEDKQVPKGVSETSWLFQLAPALRNEYLQLARNLLLTSGGRELKTLTFTSSEEQDESAFVVAEFAAVLANDMDQRVLLVDGDMYQSPLSRLFRRSKHPGLRDAFLYGDGIPETPLDPQCPRLVFLPIGIGKQEFIFRSSAFQEWERSVRESFDYILINTPPLSQNADGALLGKHADGVILVAQAERTDRGRLAVTKEQLEKAQCRVLGVVLTDNKEYIPAFLRRHVGSSR
jgi:capsular exopolysaccharide synthesis family protein